jgi:hypothetical protein
MQLFYFFAFILISNCGLLTAQQISKKNETLTLDFAFNVHSMDVFFDRFNYKKNMESIEYLRSRNPNHQLSRTSLVKSLFNLEQIGQAINFEDVKMFLTTVVDTLNPKYLRFKDNDWYAKLKCKVNYNGKPTSIDLILKVERTKNMAFKWSLVSAKGDILNFKKVKRDSLIFNMDSSLNISEKGKYFLTPVSHGLNFIDVFKIFENKKYILDYVYEGEYSFELKKLIFLIQKGEIKFIEVNRISYHLFQIADWIVEVDYFSRKSRNSGWLISQLKYATKKQKFEYLKSVLNVPVHNIY